MRRDLSQSTSTIRLHIGMDEAGGIRHIHASYMPSNHNAQNWQINRLSLAMTPYDYDELDVAALQKVDEARMKENSQQFLELCRSVHVKHSVEFETIVNKILKCHAGARRHG